MDANTVSYIVWGGIALMLAGWAAFPLNLSYDNTSWMPRWMRPGVNYLERGHEYNYPANEARAYLSIMLLLTGLAYLLSAPMLYADPSQPIPDGVAKWLTLLLPAYMLLHTFALRSLNSPGEAVYRDAVTRPTEYKVVTVFLIPFVLIIWHIAGLPFEVFRLCSIAYTALAALFLAYDFRIVYRARRSDGYLTSRFDFRQMCPESYHLLYFLLGSAILQSYLWMGDFRQPIAFGVLTLVFLLFEHVLRFHWAENYDEFLHDYDYVRHRRRVLWLYEAERLCRLAARGKGIFRNDGRTWTVIVTRHPDYRGFLYVCTSEYGVESYKLDLVGEQEVLSRNFATLHEAFKYRLYLMCVYENTHRKASNRAERMFEDVLFQEDGKYMEEMACAQ